MPKLVTILFVLAFGLPMALFATIAGMAVSTWFDLPRYATGLWCSWFGVMFGYWMRASEWPGKLKSESNRG